MLRWSGRFFSEYGLPLSSRDADEVDYLITPSWVVEPTFGTFGLSDTQVTDWNAHVKGCARVPPS